MKNDHQPLESISPTRLQVELWRVVQDEPWGPCEAPITIPKAHLEALLRYIERLEDVRLLAVSIRELLDKHPRPSLPNASFTEDANLVEQLRTALALSDPDRTADG